MNWYIAPALEVLRKQLNSLYPNRSKVSDGGIGDAAHASRNSDHNPWVKDSSGKGVVTARDFTHDPQNGLDCNELAKQLTASRDPRIKYIIWNRQICSSAKGWEWRPYKGSNPHDKHLHLSVQPEARLYADTAAWSLSTANPSATPPETSEISKELQPSPPSNTYTVKQGDFLGRIANSFRVSVEDLKRLNGLTGDTIYPGQELRVR